MLKYPAIRINQWLDVWNEYSFDPDRQQAKPLPYFYVASIPANVLQRVADVNRRRASGPRAEDLGIQRAHIEARSEEIAAFRDAGYPWASFNRAHKERYSEFRKPGWLPTAIIANLVTASTKRGEIQADPKDLIEIVDVNDSIAELNFPDGSEEESWRKMGPLPPIEIIDGQHRLEAFKDGPVEGVYELPVVFFVDLDISWQAYLFWTINITPKRINRSFAYDLFPLLRTQDWLEQFEGPMTYRETRAQELTEALWIHPRSPWYQRISMLGTERGRVSQASWIRSLTASFVRFSSRDDIGGLFGSAIPGTQPPEVLEWTRPQQAAYLMEAWAEIVTAVSASTEEWAVNLREETPEVSESRGDDAAFYGRYSLLSSDQGVRGVLHVLNDVSVMLARELDLNSWRRTKITEATDETEVSACLDDLAKLPMRPFLNRLAKDISRFDWRTSGTPHLKDPAYTKQLTFRTGTGYREVRRQLLDFLQGSGNADIAGAAKKAYKQLKFDR